MPEKTFERLVPNLDAHLRKPASRPDLLYDAAELDALRSRMADHPDLAQRIRTNAAAILRKKDFKTDPSPYYHGMPDLARLTEAQMLEPAPEIERHMLTLLAAIAEAPRWVAHVHGQMKCDHCTANIAAAMALAMEALGPALEPDDERRLTESVAGHCFTRFLDCCRERSVFWAQREHRFNWRDRKSVV